MFGTIGRARPKPGKAAEFNSVMEDWQREIRPKVPGRFVELMGRSVDRPDEIMFIALAQDEETYRRMAEMPEQHRFFERFSELTEGGISWEDVELDFALEH